MSGITGVKDGDKLAAKLVTKLGDEVKSGLRTWREAAREYNKQTAETLSKEAFRGRYRYLSGQILSGGERIRQNKNTDKNADVKKELTSRIKSLEKQCAAGDGQVKILNRQIDLLRTELRKVPIDFTGDQIKIGVVSDPHLGSVYENLELLKAAYDTFEEEGVVAVFNPGDITDDKYSHRRSKHQYEARVRGADQQVEYAVQNYPRKEGIITHFITGNHDDTFYQITGINIGDLIAAQRPDMLYRGAQECDCELKCETGSAILRMFHPLDGSASYAISYKPQRIVEAFVGGHKPNILLLGHYHKAEYLFYMNVHIIQAGTTQYQTPYLRGKKVHVAMGFWIVEFTINENGIAKCAPTWYPDYA